MAASLLWIPLLTCGSAAQEPATKRPDQALSPADPARKLITTRVTSSAEGHGEGSLALRPQLTADGQFISFAVVNSLHAKGSKDRVDKLLLGDLSKASFRVIAQEPSSKKLQPLGALSLSRAGELIAFTNASVSQVLVGSRAATDFTPLRLSKVAVAPDLGSSYPSVSANGKAIVFTSAASDLVPEDSNSSSDVFLVAIESGALECISVTPAGKPGNGASFTTMRQRSLSDGNEVLFFSNATDLVEGTVKYRPNLFLRSRSKQRTTRIAQGPMIPDQAHVSSAQYSQPDGVVALEVTSRTPVPFFGRSTIVLQWMDGSRSVDLREWIQQVEPCRSPGGQACGGTSPRRR
jgi:hypothetical protein